MVEITLTLTTEVHQQFKGSYFHEGGQQCKWQHESGWLRMLKQGLSCTWGGNRGLDVERLSDKRNCAELGKRPTALGDGGCQGCSTARVNRAFIGAGVTAALPGTAQPCLLWDETRGASPARPVIRMGFRKELLFFLWVCSPIQYLYHVQLPGSSWVCLATGRSHSAYGDTGCGV